jgi:uncharacterized membrane protein
MSSPTVISERQGPPEVVRTAPAFNLNWILLLVALLCLIPRIYLGRTQFLQYDGYWHVFIANQDRWQNLVREYKENAHPLLYYVVLRWVSHLGHEPIIYRSINIVFGSAAAFVVGKIMQRICTSRIVPIVAAAAYGLAITSIELSLEVRSYMACLFFVILSFYFFLKAIELPENTRGALSWLYFTFFASMAISFEYFALFYFAACFGAFVLAGGFDSAYRSRFFKWLRSKLSLLAAAMLIPVLTIRYFYRTHLSFQPKSFGHVGEYYWDPEEQISRTTFLLKNLQHAFSYFLPIEISSRPVFLGVLGLLLIALAAFAFTQWDKAKSLLYRAAVLIPILLILQLAVLALAQRYPFGGYMRQQSILAPFLCISLFLLVDRLVSIAPLHWSKVGLLAAAAIAVLYSAYYQWKIYPKIPTELFTDDYQRFVDTTKTPEAVYLDGFSLIAYYIHTHKWTWHTDHRVKPAEPIEEFQTSSPGGQNVDVLRSRTDWNFDWTKPATYQAMAEAMRNFHQPSMSVFHLHQSTPPLPPGTPQQHAAFVQNLAGTAGLETTKLYTDGTDFFATFKLK